MPTVPYGDRPNSPQDNDRTARMLESTHFHNVSRIWVLARGKAVDHLVKLTNLSRESPLRELQELRVAVEVEQYTAYEFFAYVA